jgi:hypothetical protein
LSNKDYPEDGMDLLYYKGGIFKFKLLVSKSYKFPQSSFENKKPSKWQIKPR